MSLEAAIEALNGNIEKLIEQNDKILGMAANRIAATEGAADKPATTRKKKDDAKGKDDEAGALKKTDVTDAFKAWLNEFGAADKHPESAARHTAMKTVLGKVLGDGKTFKDLKDDDQENIDKLHGWLENTAKKADKGHGIGRLVADPEEAGDEDDGLGV